MSRSSHVQAKRRYPRVARVNEALREVIADELERLDDDRLDMVTITGVDADPDLRHAVVFFSALMHDGLEGVTEGFAAHRVRLQRAIASQQRLKRTPELKFLPDPAVIEGVRIDAILRTLPPIDPSDEANDEMTDDESGDGRGQHGA